MSVTVDVNVLVYASHEENPLQAKAIEFMDGLAQGPDLLYLFWPVVMGYLRLSTHPNIFPRPLTMEMAQKNIEQLFALPHVRLAGEGEEFWKTYKATTSGLVVRGKLIPDAHLVTLMRENGVETIWTHDRDFRKFEGIRVRDPFV